MIVIPGEPVAKGRPRFTKTGRAYTPQKTQDAETNIGWQLKAVCPDVDAESEFTVEMVFWTKKKRIDLDNLVKLLLDSANGVVWADDSQVIGINATKQYPIGFEPKTRFKWTAL